MLLDKPILWKSNSIHIHLARNVFQIVSGMDYSLQHFLIRDHKGRLKFILLLRGRIVSGAFV